MIKILSKHNFIFRLKIYLKHTWYILNSFNFLSMSYTKLLQITKDKDGNIIPQMIEHLTHIKETFLDIVNLNISIIFDEFIKNFLAFLTKLDKKNNELIKNIDLSYLKDKDLIKDDSSFLVKFKSIDKSEIFQKEFINIYKIFKRLKDVTVILKKLLKYNMQWPNDLKSKINDVEIEERVETLTLEIYNKIIEISEKKLEKQIYFKVYKNLVEIKGLWYINLKKSPSNDLEELVNNFEEYVKNKIPVKPKNVKKLVPLDLRLYKFEDDSISFLI